MATGTSTAYDVGIRHSIKLPSGTVLGERNFEQALATASPATVQYQSRKNGLWWVNGLMYDIGSALPYDAGTATRYSANAAALLEFYWNNRFIDPTT